MAHGVGCLSSEVMAIYQDADAQTARVVAATGLQCPPGCGRCCHSPKITASVLEMLPLALDIYQTGDEEAVLAAIEKLGDDPTCVIFEANAENADQGRCARYAVRPLVCRLFGFSARRNKHGEPEVATCRVIRETQPDAFQRAQVGLQNGMAFPEAQAFFLQIAGQDPHLGYRVLPINQALREALEYLYWKRPFVPETEKIAS